MGYTFHGHVTLMELSIFNILLICKVSEVNIQFRPPVNTIFFFSISSSNDKYLLHFESALTCNINKKDFNTEIIY